MSTHHAPALRSCCQLGVLRGQPGRCQLLASCYAQLLHLHGHEPTCFLYVAQLRANLMYLQASQGVITLSSNCDLFVYLNGELVIDLGGVHTQQSATLNLIRVSVEGGMGKGASRSPETLVRIRQWRRAAYCPGRRSHAAVRAHSI